MSLEVTAPTGLGERAEQELHEVWETLDDVMTRTMKEGFMPSGRPVYAPPVLSPQFLTTLTPELYHNFNAQLSAWRTYAHELINTLQAGIKECDNELDELKPAIRKHIRQAAGEKKPSKDVVEDEVATNPRVVELVRRKQELEQKKLMVEPHHDRYGRDLRILSRALEMRRQELGFGGLEPGGPGGPKRREFW